MGRTPITPLRLAPGDRAAADAVAADMGVDLTTAIRRLIHEEVERRGLAGHAAAAFVARLREMYGANATVFVHATGEAPGGASVTIKGEKPTEAHAVVVAGVEGRDELRLEDPEGVASIVVKSIATGEPGEMSWRGTLATLASSIPDPFDGRAER